MHMKSLPDNFLDKSAITIAMIITIMRVIKENKKNVICISYIKISIQIPEHSSKPILSKLVSDKCKCAVLKFCGLIATG